MKNFFKKKRLKGDREERPGPRMEASPGSSVSNLVARTPSNSPDPPAVSEKPKAGTSYRPSAGGRSSARWVTLRSFTKTQHQKNNQNINRTIARHNDVVDYSNEAHCNEWTPEICIQLLRTPTVENFAGLKKLLSRCDASWMREFLSRRGLEALFRSLQRLARQAPASLETALALIHCVECLRAVMNCKTGLDYIVKNEMYTRELVQGIH
ncbi:inverted formin-2-like [Tropilaelaps mercedesae]|uniref:Inverted formin-2-like n=1 Tax=Tropilaelaps mercedesae TaxID=418985 RepID=A0A1V9XGY5_9ACAR|nr:inverted formin-2-like [Tropilaelaps mercedesae]